MKKWMAVTALVALAAGAGEVSVRDGEIVIDEPGDYTLAADTTVRAVRFKANATVTGDTWSGSWSAFAGAIPQTDVETRIFSGIPLELLPFTRVTIGGDWLSDRLATTVGYAKTGDSSATVQYQVTNSSWCICFKMEFTARDGDLFGKVLWSRYTNDKSRLGVAWTDDMQVSGSYSAPFSLSGICVHDFTLGENPQLTLTLTAPALIEGSGSLLVPLAGTDGLNVSNRISGVAGAIPQPNEDTLIFRGASLDDLADSRATIGGSWTAPARAAVAAGYTKIDDTTATVQYQIRNSAWFVCFKVQFSAAGGDLYGRVLWARYRDVKLNDELGVAWSDDMLVKGSYSAPFSKSSICVYDFFAARSLTLSGPFPTGTLTFDADTVTVAPEGDLTVANAIAGTFGRVVFRGSKTQLADVGSNVMFPALSARNTFTGELVLDGVTAVSRSPYLLSEDGTAVLTNAAKVTFSYGYSAQPSIARTAKLRVGPGCQAVFASDWLFAEGGALEVDAGEAVFSNPSYLEDIALANGARLTGQRFMVGNTTAAVIWSTGAETNVIAAAICGVKPTNYATQTCTFDVEAPLLLTAGLGDYGSMSGLTWTKKGTGTLVLAGDGTASKNGCASGPFLVENGTFAFGAADVLTKTNSFTLAGGALDAGAYANEIGPLTVTTNSTLVAGTGCLTFADSSAATWATEAKLSVTGATEKLPRGRIRFRGIGLTADQLGAMQYNGQLKVRLDGEGYLRSYVSGMMVVIR